MHLLIEKIFGALLVACFLIPLIVDLTMSDFPIFSSFVKEFGKGLVCIAVVVGILMIVI